MNGPHSGRYSAGAVMIVPTDHTKDRPGNYRQVCGLRV